MTVLPLDIPIDLDADPARELARAVYAAARPPLLQRVLQWISDRVDDLLALAQGVSAGGAWGVLVLVVVAVVVAVVVRRRLGRFARTSARSAVVDGAVVRTADEHRALADAAAADGRFDEAVRETMRALVRGLEERALLDERAGRTAGEVAREAAAVLPEAADAVAAAAHLFDETVYGGRTADADALGRMRAADDTARRARAVPAA
jgi:hypothetical protein